MYAAAAVTLGGVGFDVVELPALLERALASRSRRGAGSAPVTASRPPGSPGHRKAPRERGFSVAGR
jgi:hypothetical protein